jgi:hypothetical protein
MENKTFEKLNKLSVVNCDIYVIFILKNDFYSRTQNIRTVLEMITKRMVNGFTITALFVGVAAKQTFLHHRCKCFQKCCSEISFFIAHIVIQTVK